jgi:hypothetical protein
MIDQRLDLVVWLMVLLVFVLLGARAWAVETAEVSHYRTSARVRVLTGATAVAMVVLVGLAAVQGGFLLVQAVVTSTDPQELVTVVGDDDPANEAPADPDDLPAPPADPAAPPVPPGAPAPPG